MATSLSLFPPVGANRPNAGGMTLEYVEKKRLQKALLGFLHVCPGAPEVVGGTNKPPWVCPGYQQIPGPLVVCKKLHERGLSRTSFT